MTQRQQEATPASGPAYPAEYRTGMIGGRGKSWEERQELVQRHLAPRLAKAEDWGPRNECMCSSTWYIRLWGLFYCLRCGRWATHLCHPRGGKTWVTVAGERVKASQMLPTGRSRKTKSGAGRTK